MNIGVLGRIPSINYYGWVVVLQEKSIVVDEVKWYENSKQSCLKIESLSIE